MTNTYRENDQQDVNLNKNIPTFTSIATDGNIYIHEHNKKTCLSWHLEDLTYGSWCYGNKIDRIRYFWPTWSPDEKKIACIGTYGDKESEHGSAIYIFDLENNTNSWELLSNNGSAPVYMLWHKDSKKLTVLSQKQQIMNLSIQTILPEVKQHHIASGMPIFHSFSPDGTLLAISIAEKSSESNKRCVYTLNLEDNFKRTEICDNSGYSGTPSWSHCGRFLSYSKDLSENQILCVYDTKTNESIEIETFNAIATSYWSDKKLYLALGNEKEDTSFQKLYRYSVKDNKKKLVLEDTFTLFYPVKDGILYLKPIQETKGFSWFYKNKNKKPKLLFSFYPSQAQTFMLYFFHQYYSSHKLVSEDKNHILCSGYLSSEEMKDDKTMPQIFLINLNGEVETISEGTLACWVK